MQCSNSCAIGRPADISCRLEQARPAGGGRSTGHWPWRGAAALLLGAVAAVVVAVVLASGQDGAARLQRALRELQPWGPGPLQW